MSAGHGIEEYDVPGLDERVSLLDIQDGFRILMGDVVPTSTVAAENFRIPQTNTAFGSIGFADVWMDHDIIPWVSSCPIPVLKIRNLGIEEPFRRRGYGVKLTLAGLYLAIDHECDIFGVSEPNSKSSGIADLFRLDNICEDHFGYPFHYLHVQRDARRTIKEILEYLRG